VLAALRATFQTGPWLVAALRFVDA
jgi:hypothetical protein